MYETLKRLYLKGELSREGLDKAVKKGWITANQKERILSA